MVGEERPRSHPRARVRAPAVARARGHQRRGRDALPRSPHGRQPRADAARQLALRRPDQQGRLARCFDGGRGRRGLLHGDAQQGLEDNGGRVGVGAGGADPEDVGRFRSALDAIIAADGAYVGAMDLRNGHRRAMQRLVRGGALRQGNAAARAATEARVEAAIQGTIAKWAGISAKLAI